MNGMFIFLTKQSNPGQEHFNEQILDNYLIIKFLFVELYHIYLFDVALALYILYVLLQSGLFNRYEFFRKLKKPV